MEQIAQLKAMRDAAKARLMASPDWKLMVSLDALIPDLEKAFGLVADAPTSEEEGEPAEEEPAPAGEAASPTEPESASAAEEAAPEPETEPWAAWSVEETPAAAEPEPEPVHAVEAAPEPVHVDETVIATVEEFEVQVEVEGAPASEPEPLDAGVMVEEAAPAAAAAEPESDMQGELEAAIAAELDDFDIERTLMDEISVLGEEPAPAAHHNGSAEAPASNGHDHEAHEAAGRETEEDAVARALEELSNDLAREERDERREEDRGSIFTFRN